MNHGCDSSVSTVTGSPYWWLRGVTFCGWLIPATILLLCQHLPTCVSPSRHQGWSFQQAHNSFLWLVTHIVYSSLFVFLGATETKYSARWLADALMWMSVPMQRIGWNHLSQAKWKCIRSVYLKTRQSDFHGYDQMSEVATPLPNILLRHFTLGHYLHALTSRVQNTAQPVWKRQQLLFI